MFTAVSASQYEFLSIIKALILFIAGLFLAKLASKTLGRVSTKYVSSQQSMIVEKAIYFIILGLFFIAALQQLNFKLGALLASAGIVTAAVAFASQTSISNIISGLFLILEKSFRIGDRISVGKITGAVTSIDLLSVKVLTPDNTLVRVPNETLIKSKIINLTRFETRRLNLFLKISSKENIKEVKETLIKAAKDNPLCEKVPFPSVAIKKIESSEITLKLSVWVDQHNYDEVCDSLYEQIIALFQEHDIQL